MKRRNFLIGIGGTAIGSSGLSEALNRSDRRQESDQNRVNTDCPPPWKKNGRILFTESEPEVPNGAWTWFTDERAIIDSDVWPEGPRIIVGSVSAGGSEHGDIVVMWYDVGTDETGHFVLHESLEQDDHNVPALFLRPDGRYLAMYARHNSDQFSRWRVSSEPHDPTSWEPEQVFDNSADTTYSNIYRLTDDDGGNGRTYSFTRTKNFDPNVLVSSDQGTTWSYGGRLLQRSGGSSRPYVKYYGDNTAIHLTTTEEHPRVYNNSVYHGYVQDGTLYDSAGEVLKDDLLDGDADAPDPSELTTVFQAGTKFDSIEMTRAWTIDTAINAEGWPVAVFQARANDDWHDHRFFYAQYDGNEWHVHQVAKAGPGLYDAERDYTGLAAINLDDTTRLFISTPVDPRDDTLLDHHELFAGMTNNGGEIWEWEPITPNTTEDNLRPLVPAWNGRRRGRNKRTALVWMQGDYSTYRSWQTQGVGSLDPSQSDLTLSVPEEVTLEEKVSAEIEATLTNNARRTITHIEFSLSTLKDWKVESISNTEVGNLHSNESVTATWSVTPPATGSATPPESLIPDMYEGTVRVEFSDTDDCGIEKTIEFQILDGAVSLALDSGGPNSPVLDTYERLSPEDAWDPSLGYGWVGDPPAFRDRSTPDELRRDFTLDRSRDRNEPATLRLAVPAGKHQVYILTGDPSFPIGNTIVSSAGEVLGQSGDDIIPEGKFKWFSFEMDGGNTGRTVDLQITGELRNGYWIINGLVML